MTESLRRWITEGETFSAVDLQRALLARTRLYRDVQAWFEDVDLVVMPTLSRPALAADHDPFDPVEIDGRPVGEVRATWYPYTHHFNLVGNPAITVPCDWTGDGLPVGLQIVGPWFAEREVLAAAAVFERLRPWAQRRPSL